MTSSSSPCDAAVSPIIATILLVMLTVTVIAVAAVVVINISEGYGDQKTVDIRVSPAGDNEYKVVVTGGADAAELTSLSAHVDKVTFEDDISDPVVGLPSILKVASSPSAGEALMTLIGTFTDGTVQLVYEGRVEVGVGGTGNLPKPVPTTAKPTEEEGGDTPGGGESGGEDIPPISEENIWNEHGLNPNSENVVSWGTVSPWTRPSDGIVYYDSDNAYLYIFKRDISLIGEPSLRRETESLKEYAERNDDPNIFQYFYMIQLDPFEPSISMNKAPTESTYGNPGDLYLDTSTGYLYVCTDSTYNFSLRSYTYTWTYTWKHIATKISTS